MTESTSVLLSFVLLVATTAVSCRLDESSKQACDNSTDCFSGYVCVDHICEGFSRDASTTPTPSAEFSEPANVAVVFQQATTCFEVTWDDRANIETEFEIQRSISGVATTPSDFFYLARTAADVGKVELCFPRTEAFSLRVCALRKDGPPACSRDISVTVGFNQVYAASSDLLPSKPVVGSSSNEDRSTTLSWSLNEMDFRDTDPNRCGFRIYECKMSGVCDDLPSAWGSVIGLPATESSYALEAVSSSSGFCDFAVAAYNRYGESPYSVVSGLPCVQ